MAEAEKAGTSDRVLNWLFLPLRQSQTTSVLLAAGLIAAIAIIDWRSADDVPLGFLYLLPMLIVGRVLRPRYSLIFAATCTYLTERFDPFPWHLRTGLPRDFLYLIAFATIGFFVYHSSLHRDLTMEQMGELERQNLARLQAEQQLAALIETSPAAVFTTDLAGTVVAANHAAHQMLTAEPGSLIGQNLPRYFPSLQLVLQRSENRPSLRTAMQTRGVRSDGESFVSEVCFSTYPTAAGLRFTAMILDASEDFRSREEASLHQILVSSRLAVSAMSHEIRNVSGAIAAVHRNMRSREVLSGDQDFDALGSLVVALERIATIDLMPHPKQLSEVDLRALIDDLKIIISPELSDHQIRASWHIDAALPPVWADPESLLQIFLNLTTNSIRALSGREGERWLGVKARGAGANVVVEILDNGGGIAPGTMLFRPFQPGAQQSGLGLYLARAFARSFGGDLQHSNLPDGAMFSVILDAVKPA